MALKSINGALKTYVYKENNLTSKTETGGK